MIEYEGIDRWTQKNSLEHYGVLGMKWGIRKAESRGQTYQYKSIGQKMKQRKVNRLQSKINSTKNSTKKSKLTEKLKKQTNKLNNLKSRDKRREQYARSASVGGAVARTVLFGPIGNGTYERLRSAGSSQVEAGAAMAAAWFLTPVGGAVASKIIENNPNKYYGKRKSLVTGR